MSISNLITTGQKVLENLNVNSITANNIFVENTISTNNLNVTDLTATEINSGPITTTQITTGQIVVPIRNGYTLTTNPSWAPIYNVSADAQITNFIVTSGIQNSYNSSFNNSTQKINITQNGLYSFYIIASITNAQSINYCAATYTFKLFNSNYLLRSGPFMEFIPDVNYNNITGSCGSTVYCFVGDSFQINTNLFSTVSFGLPPTLNNNNSFVVTVLVDRIY